ncbi:unnamed protein product, partial [Meganyctiphanes norvegica]
MTTDLLRKGVTSPRTYSGRVRSPRTYSVSGGRDEGFEDEGFDFSGFFFPTSLGFGRETFLLRRRRRLPPPLRCERIMRHRRSASCTLPRFRHKANVSSVSIQAHQATLGKTLPSFQVDFVFGQKPKCTDYSFKHDLVCTYAMTLRSLQVGAKSSSDPRIESQHSRWRQSKTTAKTSQSENRTVAVQTVFQFVSSCVSTECRQLTAPGAIIATTSFKNKGGLAKCCHKSRPHLELISLSNWSEKNFNLENSDCRDFNIFSLFSRYLYNFGPRDKRIYFKVLLESLKQKKIQRELRTFLRREFTVGKHYNVESKFKKMGKFSESLDEAAKRKDTLQDADRILNATSQQNTVHQAALRNQDNRHNHGQNRPFEDSIIGSATNPEEERDPEEIIKTSLFVGHIPRTMTEEEVRNLFEPYGQIKDIRIHKNKKGLNRGCCFLDYWNEETASAAKEATDQLDFGSEQKLDVRFAYPPKPKNPPKYTEPHVNRNASASEVMFKSFPSEFYKEL